MKPIIIFLLIFCVICTHAQPIEPRLFDVLKEWPTKKVIITDGLIYKYSLPTDSARRFDPGVDNYEVVVSFRRVGATPVTEKVDGQLATFTGIWVRTSSNPTWYLNTIAFSNSPGSTVSYTFTGTRIELHAERLATHGQGKISIDSGAETIVSFNTVPFGLPVLIYSSPTLTLGVHTIKLTVVSGFNLLDYFILTK